MDIWDIENSDEKIYFIEKASQTDIRSKIYSNQTGGCSCNHPSMRGILHEFADNDFSLLSFSPKWWYDEAHKFSRVERERQFKADLEKIKPENVEHIEITKPFGEIYGSEEAWVFVKITYKDGKVKNGVLTWLNSD